MPKKKSLMETSQVTEVAPVKRSTGSREHLSYPDHKGRKSPLAEELARHLRPRIRETVLHPPKIEKPIVEVTVATILAADRPSDKAEPQPQSNRCRRCREGKYQGEGKCNYCGHHKSRPVRKS